MILGIGRKRTVCGFPVGLKPSSRRLTVFRFQSEILSAEELIGLKLLAKAELLHDGLVAVGIVRLEVVEQATPLAHQHKKTAA